MKADEFGGGGERRTARGDGEHDGVEGFLFDVEAGAETQGELAPEQRSVDQAVLGHPDGFGHVS